MQELDMLEGVGTPKNQFFQNNFSYLILPFSAFLAHL
jgi:hypothetical protein